MGDNNHPFPEPAAHACAGAAAALAGIKGLRTPERLRRAGLARSHRRRARLDNMVGDRSENCLDVVVDSKARAILVCVKTRTCSPARHSGWAVVKTVGECPDTLTEVDFPRRDQPGIIERVMRLLSLEEPASAS